MGIINNCFYELPEGMVVITAGGTFSEKCSKDCINYRDSEGNLYITTETETVDWKCRTDLNEFPNTTNPNLPYVFDLLWDLKKESDIIDIFHSSHSWFDGNIFELIDKLKEYNLTHLIPQSKLSEAAEIKKTEKIFKEEFINRTFDRYVLIKDSQEHMLFVEQLMDMIQLHIIFTNSKELWLNIFSENKDIVKKIKKLGVKR
jgi:hypothetical protein